MTIPTELHEDLVLPSSDVQGLLPSTSVQASAHLFSVTSACGSVNQILPRSTDDENTPALSVISTVGSLAVHQLRIPTPLVMTSPGKNLTYFRSPGSPPSGAMLFIVSSELQEYRKFQPAGHGS